MAKPKPSNNAVKKLPLKVKIKKIQLASEQLTKLIQTSKNSKLAKTDDSVILHFIFQRILERGRFVPIKIPLPNSLFDSQSKIAVIAKNATDLKAKLAQIPLEFGELKVIDFASLKDEYHSYCSRRALLKQNDLFLADKRVVDRLPKLLGKAFLKNNRMPVPVKLHGEEVPENIKIALKSARFCLTGSLDATIKIAKTSFPVEKVVQNAMAVIDFLSAREATSLSNTQRILLKTQHSLSLPIFANLPEAHTKLDLRALGETGDECVDAVIARFAEDGDNAMDSFERK